MKRQRTIKALDNLAMAYIHGEVNTETIFSLCVIDQWAVRSLADIYSMCLFGIQSRDCCKKQKKGVLQQYDMFKTRFAYIEVLYYKLVETVRVTSGKSCEITKALQKCDFMSALKNSLECLDAFQNGNVYMKVFESAVSDEDFKKTALKVAESQVDTLMNAYGPDVPYAKMIERFYAAADEDGMTEIFKYLDPDKYNPLVDEMPEKSDDEKLKRSVADNMKALYGVKTK